jgi:integrase
MRTTKVRLAQAKVGGRRYWCVTYPKPGTGRNRRFFKDRAEAQTFFELKKIEKDNHGTAAMSLSEKARAEYLECQEALRPYGSSIREAVAHFLPHLKARSQSCKIPQLVERLLATKASEGKSPRYLKDLRLRLGAFAGGFSDRLAADVTHAEVERWLLDLQLSANSRNNYRRVIVVLFNFAMAHHFCAENPAETVGLVKVVDRPPGILTPDEASALLTVAPPALLPYLTIGLFAGLRRAELERLDWREVKLDQGFVEVTAKNAKTARRRLVRIEPNLLEWLRPIACKKGPIWPVNFENLFDQAREAAGLSDWPDNALRHSFASYHLAHYSDAARTALELGHTSTRLLFSAYRELVTKQEALRFWNIAPAASSHRVEVAA